MTKTTIDALATPASGQGEAPELALARANLLELLRAQALRYTQGESTSLPRETMTELLTSLCYTLSIDPRKGDSALLPLAEGDPHERYAKALERLRKKADCARVLAGQLCLSAPPLDCIALRDTLRSIVEGLNGYDPRFFAHRVPGSIDYQLLRPVPERMQGVDYILAYLTRLHAELRLLSRLPLHRVLALLDGFSPEWRELVANLYAPVATNALGLALLGGDPRRLHIGDAQRAELCDLLGNCPAKVIEERLFAAARTVCRALDLREEDDTALLLSLALDLAPRVHAACAAGDLSRVFVAFGVPGRQG